MNEVILNLKVLDLEVIITPWKLVGYLGVLLFAGRWVVQLWVSRAAGRSVMPRLFWYMSISGSLMLLTYFTFGKNDSVGIMANLFPAFTAGYNLWLELRPKSIEASLASASGELDAEPPVEVVAREIEMADLVKQEVSGR